MSDVFLSPSTQARIRALMERAGIAERDLVERFVLGGGRGGQKLNKTSSCVQLRHVPTGTDIRCQQTRARAVNRWLARRLLAERLLERRRAEDSERLKLAEKIRRRKRRRTRRQRERVLEEKRLHSAKKRLRAPVEET